MLDPRDLGGGEDRRDEEFSRMSPKQRLELFLELCEMSDAIVRSRPDADKLRAPHPRSAESEALWQRLIERARRERGG